MDFSQAEQMEKQVNNSLKTESQNLHIQKVSMGSKRKWQMKKTESQTVHTVLKQYNLKRAKFQEWEEKD